MVPPCGNSGRMGEYHPASPHTVVHVSRIPSYVTQADVHRCFQHIQGFMGVKIMGLCVGRYCSCLLGLVACDLVGSAPPDELFAARNSAGKETARKLRTPTLSFAIRASWR